MELYVIIVLFFFKLKIYLIILLFYVYNFDGGVFGVCVDVEVYEWFVVILE